MESNVTHHGRIITLAVIQTGARFGGIDDAPNDGKIYGRQGGQWVEITAQLLPELTAPALTVTEVTHNSITATVTDPEDLGNFVWYLDDVEVATGTQLEYTYAPLDELTPYSLTVAAYDAENDRLSPVSAAVIETTLAKPAEPPAYTPPTLTLVSKTDTTINLSASNPDSLNLIELYMDGVLTASGSVFTFELSALTAATSYEFTARTGDGEGNWSALSEALVVVTDEAGSVDVLTLPTVFPVSLYRDSESYKVAETIDDYRSTYSGTVYVDAEIGDDSIGDGTLVAPYKTLDAAIISAPVNSSISLAGGEYTFPSAPVTKNLRFCKTGSESVFFGEFIDTSALSFTAADTAGTRYYTVNVVNESLPLLDGFIVTGESAPILKTKGSREVAFSLCKTWAQSGYPACFQSTSTNNFSMFLDAPTSDAGNADTLNNINNAGGLKIWAKSQTGVFEVSGADVLVDDGIIMCGSRVNIFHSHSGASIILGACEFYGTGSSLVLLNSDSIMFGTKGGGSSNNAIDYDFSGTANVEIGVEFYGSLQNNSTSHAPDVLRVGGKYNGGGAGARLVSDLTTSMYLFSCEIIQDLPLAAYSNVRFGTANSTSGTQLIYGDLNLGVSEGGSVTEQVDNNAINDPIVIGLNDEWPFD